MSIFLYFLFTFNQVSVFINFMKPEITEGSDETYKIIILIEVMQLHFVFCPVCLLIEHKNSIHPIAITL